MNNTIYFFLVLLLTITSCQKENQIISDSGRKIVINGLLTTDSLIGVHISGSLKIDDSSILIQNNVINNAKVLMFENEVFMDSLWYSEITYLGQYFLLPNNYRLKTFYPRTGNQYKTTINAPGMPEASAVTTFPNVVEIDKVDTSVVKLTGIFENWESNVRLISSIEFNDPVNEKNYYLLHVHMTPNYFSESNNIQFSCNDPIVEEKINQGSIMEGIAFSDKSINGQKHKLMVTLNGKDIGKPFWNGTEYAESHRKVIYFNLYSITEDYFKYIQTLNLFFKNYKNPLTEPTQVYSNVTGGYGIFAGAAVSSDSLVFNY